MNGVLWLIFALCIVSLILSFVIIILFLRLTYKEEKKDVFLASGQWDTLHGNISEIRSKLDNLSGAVSERLATNFFGIKGDLGKLLERTSSLIEYTKEIGELKSLFQPPKSRGKIGEVLLEQLLKDVLPQGVYKFQHKLGDELIPDAIIELQNKFIVIDAKFPLRSYSRLMDAKNGSEKESAYKQLVRDIKTHIEEVAKYIRVELNTYDFAFMYIPTEAVFYEVFIKADKFNEELNSFAKKMKVIPVSPNTFYAYLQSIAYGLKGLEVEKEAKKIWEIVLSMEEDFKRLIEYLTTGESYLSKALRYLSYVKEELKKIFTKLSFYKR